MRIPATIEEEHSSQAASEVREQSLSGSAAHHERRPEAVSSSQSQTVEQRRTPEPATELTKRSRKKKRREEDYEENYPQILGCDSETGRPFHVLHEEHYEPISLATKTYTQEEVEELEHHKILIQTREEHPIPFGDCCCPRRLYAPIKMFGAVRALGRLRRRYSTLEPSARARVLQEQDQDRRSSASSSASMIGAPVGIRSGRKKQASKQKVNLSDDEDHDALEDGHESSCADNTSRYGSRAHGSDDSTTDDEFASDEEENCCGLSDHFELQTPLHCLKLCCCHPLIFTCGGMCFVVFQVAIIAILLYAACKLSGDTMHSLLFFAIPCRWMCSCSLS